jgi:Co/Zn/Cd efflux system component
VNLQWLTRAAYAQRRIMAREPRRRSRVSRHHLAPIASGGSRRPIYAALAGSLAVALTKAAATAWTGSTSMLSEAIHSAVDSATRASSCWASAVPRARRMIGTPSDTAWCYFWAFVVALMIFMLGGAVSI